MCVNLYKHPTRHPMKYSDKVSIMDQKVDREVWVPLNEEDHFNSMGEP